MDLKAKLARLGAPGVSTSQDTPAATPNAPVPPANDRRVLAPKAQLAAFTEKQRERHARVYKRPTAVTPYHLPGHLRVTSAGEVQVQTTRYPLAHRHGQVAILPASGYAAPVLAMLGHDNALADIDPLRLLFLDTETTGLAGGTGTLAFLVGLGFFEADAFVVEQLFLSQIGQEPALLEHLRERLQQASALVTYNGKSFDWPLLRTRSVMNRGRLPEPLHLDLLHAARRVFRYRLPGFRLQQVETELLRHERIDDIPGAEIPPRYWEFLRSGNGQLVAPILAHNCDDIVALPATLGLLHQAIMATAPTAEPCVSLGVARLAIKQALPALLEQHLAIAETGDAAIATTALRLRAQAALKRGELGTARDALERALLHATPDGVLAAHVHLRLAKLCEHKLKDFEQALHHSKHTAQAEGLALQHRRERRLKKKRALELGRTQDGS